MGAIFVYNTKRIKNPVPALSMFDEMGFSSPTFYDIGEWKIYAYPKIALSVSNSLSANGYTLVSAGTPVYKGLNYSDSLSALLQDYRSDCIDMNQLIGQYTIFFCHGDSIEVLCDPLGSKHLFTDKGHSMLSSHMLPVCECFDGMLNINRHAFYEKLLTGIIMPPNTMFEEIIQIDKQEGERITRENIGIAFIQTDSLRASKSGARTTGECLSHQANALQEYFELLNNSGRDGIDIGLSGGYDSRLGLACLYKFNKGKIHLHSHSTENVHRKDLTIAKKMADYVGVPCHTVATKKLSHCDNVDEILRKSILYFDGRSSFSIGGCGEVYTAQYRKDSTESTPFTLTGVGGELYRNIFDIGFEKIRFDHFMKTRVFSQSFMKAIPDYKYREISESIISRSAARLGIDQQKRQSKTVAHRYYCEIMMPDGQGVALDAYNQVSCCVAPFIEPRIIAKGYEAVPFHHAGGEFEGKLIDSIDPGLAAIPSSYGYPIGNRPVKAKIKERLRTYISPTAWGQLAGLKEKKEAFNLESALDELCVNSLALKEAYVLIKKLFPEIDFTQLLRTKEDIRKIQFVAMTIYSFKRRLRTK